MRDKIEMMIRIRKRILFVVLTGTILSFVLLMVPSLNTFFRWSPRITSDGGMLIFRISMGLWLLSLLVSGGSYRLYRHQMQRDPALPMAVNDERIKLCRLKAFRVSFFTIVFLTIFWKWEESGLYPEILRTKFPLPFMPILVLYGAVISLVASFLWLSRDTERKKGV
jgi:hypothetical protein